MYNRYELTSAPFPVCRILFARERSSACISLSSHQFLCPRNHLGIGGKCSFLPTFYIRINFVYFQNDRVYRSIVTCQWYLLRPKEQRMFGYLLQNCQKPRTLSVGDFADLNMVTCLGVILVTHFFLFIWFVANQLISVLTCSTFRCSKQFIRSHVHMYSCTHLWTNDRSEELIARERQQQHKRRWGVSMP